MANSMTRTMPKDTSFFVLVDRAGESLVGVVTDAVREEEDDSELVVDEIATS
jgi:hypothetical protein